MITGSCNPEEKGSFGVYDLMEPTDLCGILFGTIETLGNDTHTTHTEDINADNENCW